MKIEVRFEDETGGPSQTLMAELFGTTKHRQPATADPLRQATREYLSVREQTSGFRWQNKTQLAKCGNADSIEFVHTFHKILRGHGKAAWRGAHERSSRDGEKLIWAPLTSDLR